MRRVLVLSAAALLPLAALPLRSATLVLPEHRRVAIIEELRDFLNYQVPSRDQLRLLPDAFVFGREIEEEKPEPVVEGLSDEELLEEVAARLAADIVGYQDFGDRSFFATRDFGLLREGDTVTVEIEEQPGQPVTARIIGPSRAGFTIQIGEGLETFVPANTMPRGIQPARPANP